jgi:hypothetical protein
LNIFSQFLGHFLSVLVTFCFFHEEQLLRLHKHAPIANTIIRQTLEQSAKGQSRAKFNPLRGKLGGGATTPKKKENFAHV